MLSGYRILTHPLSSNFLSPLLADRVIQGHGRQGMRTLNQSHPTVPTPNSMALVEWEAEIIQEERNRVWGQEEKRISFYPLHTTL